MPSKQTNLFQFKHPKPSQDSTILTDTPIYIQAVPLDILFQERIQDLIDNRQDYMTSSGDPSLSISNLPYSILICAERIQGTVEAKTKKTIGINIILNFLLYHGLRLLADDHRVTKCRELRNKFRRIPQDTDGEIVYVMSQFMSKFDVNLPSGKRKNFPTHFTTYSTISLLSQELGCNLCDMACLSIMYSITEEMSNLSIDDHNDEMEKVLKSFLSRIEIRNIGLAVLMKEYKID